jgi:hypothetical protein
MLPRVTEFLSLYRTVRFDESAPDRQPPGRNMQRIASVAQDAMLPSEKLHLSKKPNTDRDMRHRC